MKIVLLRYGKPKVDGSWRLSPAEFRQWVLAYDQAGIGTNVLPPENALGGQCAARALVGYVARHTKERHSPPVVLAHPSKQCHCLYDKVAVHSSFIRYEMALP